MSRCYCFEDCFEYYKAVVGSDYEKDNGLSVLRREVIVKDEGFVVLGEKTSDERWKVVFFFSTNKRNSNWFYLVPSDSVFRGLEELMDFFRSVSVSNDMVRVGGTGVLSFGGDLV